MNTLVITDGYTLNPGDLSWKALEDFGNVHIYDRTSPAEMVQRCKEASVIVTNKTPVPADVIAACKSLKVIAVTATGYNIVDIEAAKSHSVLVCNVPGYGTDSVAQHTFALLLELASHCGRNTKSVYDGEWSQCPDFCYTKAPITELSGKTLGIVGYGRIGKKVAQIGEAFGMKAIHFTTSGKPGVNGAVTLEELFEMSDVVSLHCPLTRSNEKFVNASLLSRMKKSAFLLNTSRGQLINEPDLRNALLRGTLAAAALDVLSVEPPPENHPLLHLENCLITPHTAWMTAESRKRIMTITVENIQAALGGKPQNLVNP